ncbi:DUF2384 domain-containing protein [Arthrobacter oryzae]|uniref:DUF2384 domain-containing protein n=1 Tax=Arthrobacter oryzae TaxID=409290 RepID=A0A3N0BRW4_9MICC|nr:DUF2384 domain-containing protein [Arthrobacter oryzae]RNL51410.1 DUF2384 domain-containing protein [Arthrobacter oryzae]
MIGPDDVDAMVTRAAGPGGRAVVSRLLSLMGPEAALLWLQGSEPFFGGARPIDVLAIDGPAPVLEALNAFEQGGFA